nr:GNAT family N-acetyltransferase [Massilia sp. TS11]
MALRTEVAPGTNRFAICPYPAQQEETVAWQGELLHLRPVRPEDAGQHRDFFEALDPADVRLRFFESLKSLDAGRLARLTQIDYEREMAFIAERLGADGRRETLGVARAVADPDLSNAEFAIVVRSRLKGKGLGRLLLDKLVRYCRERGMDVIEGETLAHNQGMRELAQSLGFSITQGEMGCVNMRLDLRAQGKAA